MRAGPQRLVIAAASTLVGLALAWALWRGRGAGEAGVQDQRASVDLLLLERQLAPRGLGPFEFRPVPRDMPREPLDETTVFRMFRLGPFMQWDPLQCFRYQPNLEETIPFPPRGRDYVRRTNADGYREDHPTPRPRPDLYVVATGDSHTDGICENPESWPNRLEALLASAHPGQSVEVLNAGVQVYSYYHYLASIERALPLGPDVIVTLSYGGNDFLEVLLLHHVYQHTVQPPRPREYWDALKKAKDVHEAELTQVLYQALYFQRYPDEEERAIAASSGVCAQIQRACAQHGVRWIFAFLPSAYGLPWPEWADQRAADVRALGLTEHEMEVENRLADRLLGALRGAGVEVVDLRDELRGTGGGWYWDELHLNVRGLEKVAEILLPSVEAALAQPH